MLIGTGAIDPAKQGSSVALSRDGNTALAGGYDDSTAKGAAWVYTRSGRVWTQQGNKLVGAGATSHSHQGWSVALSSGGDTAIVGGPGDNADKGAVWVFTHSAGVWAQQGTKLVGDDARNPFAGGARQGYSVALSGDGNTAIVGGYRDNQYQGAAWVFIRKGSVWIQQGKKLVGAGATSPARQGFSVALSGDGDTAIVGGPRDSLNTGAAWIFTRRDGVWTQQATKLVGLGWIPGTAGPQQGSSVALSGDGNTAVLGGWGDSDSAPSMGAAWVFTRNGDVWTQQGSKLVGTGATLSFAGFGAQQGHSVALSLDGNTAIVGGWVDDTNRGAAWIYTRSSGMWSQLGGKLVGAGGTNGPRQGGSVALSGDGNTAILGGHRNNADRGAAWVFVK